MSKQVMPVHLKFPLLPLNSSSGFKQGESVLHGIPMVPAQGSNRLSTTSLFFWQKFWENPSTEAMFIVLENETTVKNIQKSITTYIEGLRINK